MVKIMKMVMVMMLNVQNIHISPSRSSLKLSHPSLSPRRLTTVDSVSHTLMSFGSCWIQPIGNISMGNQLEEREFEYLLPQLLLLGLSLTMIAF